MTTQIITNDPKNWEYTCACSKFPVVTSRDTLFCFRCGKPVFLRPIPPPDYQKRVWWNRVRFRAYQAFEVLVLGESLIIGTLLWLPDRIMGRYLRPLYFPRMKSLKETGRVQLAKEGVPGWRPISSEARDIAHEILYDRRLWNPSPAEDLLKLTEEALAELPVEQLKKLQKRINKVLREKGPEKARKEIRFERKVSCLYLTVDGESQLVPFDI